MKVLDRYGNHINTIVATTDDDGNPRYAVELATAINPDASIGQDSSPFIGLLYGTIDGAIRAACNYNKAEQWPPNIAQKGKEQHQ